MTKLETINAEDLQNRTYEPTPFLVDELIPEGLHILAGAPKIGKSWLALWLCLCVAQGQALWNFATTQGEALYLSLEDSFQRSKDKVGYEIPFTRTFYEYEVLEPADEIAKRIEAHEKVLMGKLQALFGKADT